MCVLCAFRFTLNKCINNRCLSGARSPSLHCTEYPCVRSVQSAQRNGRRWNRGVTEKKLKYMWDSKYKNWIWQQCEVKKWIYCVDKITCRCQHRSLVVSCSVLCLKTRQNAAVLQEHFKVGFILGGQKIPAVGFETVTIVHLTITYVYYPTKCTHTHTSI